MSLRRQFALMAVGMMVSGAVACGGEAAWKVGLARTKVTPEKPLWMAGYGDRKHPSEGTLHDLWLKVLALEDVEGHKAVLVTSDLLGFPKTISEPVTAEIKSRYGLDRDRIMLTSSHTHCGPVLRESLYDIYGLDERQIELIQQYSRELERKVVAAVGEALSRMAPATLSAGEGEATFAVNRRNNKEADVPRLMEAGTPLKGPVDHSVPVLAVKGAGGKLLAVVCGYACHNTTLNFYQWCGDYAGFAQIELEKNHPGTMAMFWAGCGADQNPLPRRKVELAAKYGGVLAAGVEKTLGGALRPVAPRLRTAFDVVTLEFERNPTEAELREAAKAQGYDGRWARRMLRLMEEGKPMASGYPYPVQAWRLGDQLWIALGGEVVVDYARMFKEKYGPHTWVAGYSNDVMAYIPSKRVWTEGGYESGALHIYGLPADKWAGDIEERVTAAVGRVVKATGK